MTIGNEQITSARVAPDFDGLYYWVIVTNHNKTVVSARTYMSFDVALMDMCLTISENNIKTATA